MNTNHTLAKNVFSRATGGGRLRRAGQLARRAGFSLVEVTLAVGIMGFAFVSILGLVPVGLTSFRETKNVSVASQIAQQIFAEVQSTPFASLIDPSGSGRWRLPPPAIQSMSNNNSELTAPLRYFDEQGQELSASDPTAVAQAIYQVNVRVLSATAFVQNSGSGGANPNPNLATVSIQIAYNPGGQRQLDATQQDPLLWTGYCGLQKMSMFSYETLVARN